MNLEQAGRSALANAKNFQADVAVVRRPHLPGGYDAEWADTAAGRKDRVFVVKPKDTLELVLAQTTEKYQDVVKLREDVLKLRRRLLELRETHKRTSPLDLGTVKKLFTKTQRFMKTTAWGRERDESTAKRLMDEVIDELRRERSWELAAVEKLDTATSVLLGALQRGSV